jgi:hypothetical protein
VVAVLKPDHVRDVDRFVRRYDARAFGPDVFFRDDIPATDPGADLSRKQAAGRSRCSP